MKLISHSEIETIQIAKKIASNLKKGDILVLSGNLGAGKTKFTEGILSYFGLQNEISSPTFTIVNEYETEKFPLFHFDVYRLEDSNENIGIEEYFDKGGVTIIEWADIIKDILPEERLDITFKIVGENSRVMVLTPHGEKYVNICEAVIW